MDTIGFTKKYSGLSSIKGVNSLAEVTEIKNNEFMVTQNGQRWHSRLACWIKDSTSSFFSPLRKNATNTAWGQLSDDLSKDETIEEDSKQLTQTKIGRWQKKGVPLRILHVRQLLRQVGKDFDRRPPSECTTVGSLTDGVQIEIKLNLPKTETPEDQDINPLGTNEGKIEGLEIRVPFKQRSPVDSPLNPKHPGLMQMRVSERHRMSTKQSWSCPTGTESEPPLNSGKLTALKRRAITDPYWPLMSWVGYLRLQIRIGSVGRDEGASSMTVEGFKELV